MCEAPQLVHNSENARPRFPGTSFCSLACERGTGGLPRLGAKSLGFQLPFIPATCKVATQIGEDCDKLKKVALRKEAAVVPDQVIWAIQEIRLCPFNVVSWTSGV